MYFVQSQPLIQYGPLTLGQLKELYINEVVHDNTYIASSSSIASFSKGKTNNNAFHIIPNEEPLWTPIHSMDTIFTELEEAMAPFNKNRHNTKHKNTENQNNPKVNFQVNMNMNANNGGTMDINMNITNNNNSNHHHHRKSIHHNLTKKEMASQQFEINLLQQKNRTLSKLNKDLQKEMVSLKAKYQSQCQDLRTKMMKQFEEYKKQKQVHTSYPKTHTQTVHKLYTIPTTRRKLSNLYEQKSTCYDQKISK